MDCRHVDRLLEANLEGRLSGFERVALRQHLRVCQGCRVKVDGMRAFAASVEQTLACGDGPDWRRLAPPVIPSVAAAEPRRTPPPPVTAPPQPSRRKAWSSMALVLAGAAALALVVPYWTRPAPTIARGWVEEALAVEATRLLAGATPHLVTADLNEASRWFAERGLPRLPALDLPDGAILEGASLLYYDEARVAGLTVLTREGMVSLHLRPEPGTPGTAPPVQGAGLEARPVGFGDWQIAVIAPTRSAAASSVFRRLDARLPSTL